MGSELFLLFINSNTNMHAKTHDNAPDLGIGRITASLEDLMLQCKITLKHLKQTFTQTYVAMLMITHAQACRQR